jgi:hypothetical protein
VKSLLVVKAVFLRLDRLARRSGKEKLLWPQLCHHEERGDVVVKGEREELTGEMVWVVR